MGFNGRLWSTPNREEMELMTQEMTAEEIAEMEQSIKDGLASTNHLRLSSGRKPRIA